MIEEIATAVIGMVFKSADGGAPELQADVLLSGVLLSGMALLYKTQLHPLLVDIKELLPQWRERATRLDAMMEAHGQAQARIQTIAEQLESVDTGYEKTMEHIRSLATQLSALDQSSHAATKELHSETQRKLLEWLERAEDRTAERDRQLAVIQSEVRSLSTLLMATSSSRYCAPLS